MIELCFRANSRKLYLFQNSQFMAPSNQSNNFFSNSNSKTELTKSDAISFLGSSFKENGSNEAQKSLYSNKKSNFRADIRKKTLSDKMKTRRQVFSQYADNSTLLNDLIDICKSQSLADVQLEKVIPQIKNQIKHKQFLLEEEAFYVIANFTLRLARKMEDLALHEKHIVLQILSLASYYRCQSFDGDQKQMICEMVLNELQRMKISTHQLSDYCFSLVALLVNVTAQFDININLHLIDRGVVDIILERANQIRPEGQCFDWNMQNQQVHDFVCIQRQLMKLITNLSKETCTNKHFFDYIMKNFMNDPSFIQLNTVAVLKIMKNFFQSTENRENFIIEQQYYIWYSQLNFPKYPLMFKNNQNFAGPYPMIGQEQAQIYYQVISNLQVLLKYCNDTIEEQKLLFDLINTTINCFFLSEFLIQFSERDSGNGKHIKYVEKAIKLYNQLACDENLQTAFIIKIYENREIQDVFKVLLKYPYFTSWRVSSDTLSLLSKLLSKDIKLLQILMELRITESLDDFFSMDESQMQPEQIFRMIDFLMIMMEADNDLMQEKNIKRGNYVANMIDTRNWAQKIQQYQKLQKRSLTEKIDTFLTYLPTKLTNNKNESNSEWD